MNYSSRIIFVVVVSLATVVITSAIVFLGYHYCFVRIHDWDSLNRGRLFQIKCAMLNYRATYGVYPSGSFYDDAEPKLSWRVQLLPFLGEESLYFRFLSHPNGSKGADGMTLAPTCYRVEDDSSSTSLFFMIPSPKLGEQPTIVGVKKAQFHWYDNKDMLLLELINTQPPDKKLYEVVSGDITLCNLNDSSVLVLASDGEIYYLPITTTVDIFKKLFDNHSIKMLNQTKKGKLTYFTNAVVAQTYIPDQIPETNSEIEQVDAKNLIDEPVGKR